MKHTMRPIQTNTTSRINDKDKNGNTILHRAIEHGSIYWVRKLISEGADIEAKNNKGETPLQLAIVHHNPRFSNIFSALLQTIYLKNDRAEIIKFLVNEVKVNVNAVDFSGNSPLILATKLAKPELVDFLLRDGKAEPTIKDRFKKTALHVAAEEGRINIVRMLVDYNCNLIYETDWQGNTPLHLAVNESKLEIVKLLLALEHTTINTTNDKGKLPLHNCANHKSTEITELLLLKDKNGINHFTHDKFTPLHLAILNNRLAVAKVLILDGNADVNIPFPNNTNLLNYAINENKTHFAKLLINNNINLKKSDQDGNTPLHCAIIKRNLEIVQYLLDQKIDVKPVNKLGETPLYCAVNIGNVESVKLLLAAGSSLNLQTKSGLTPLHCAIMKGTNSIIDILLNASDIDPNLRDAQNETVLFYAIKSKNISVISALLKNPALDLNTTNIRGETIVHVAIRFYQKEIFELLINQSTIDFTIVDRHGASLLTLAAQARKLDCIKLLLTIPSVKNLPNTPEDLLTNNTLMLASQVGDLELVNKLLEFPVILQNVTANRNGAFRAALANNHMHVVERLISIAAVRDFAAADENLRAIAADDESATRMLDNQGLGLLFNIKKYYGSKFQILGAENILANYQAFLKSQYDLKPAYDIKGKVLPLEPFNSAIVQTPYYKNLWHTAWRYFLRPNPWIAKDMPYADILPNGRAASIPANDKEAMAYLWLAASDDTILLDNNVSAKSLKKLFTREISLIARAHNWDKKRRNQVGLLEEYDDEEADKPSCSIGVSRRLIQSIFEHPLAQRPESRELTPGVFRRRFLEQLLSENPSIQNNLFYKLTMLSLDQLTSLKDALDQEIEECIPLTEEQEAFFQIPEDAIALFIEDAKLWFGSARISGQPVTWGHSYDNYEQFGVSLAKQCKKYCYSEMYEILKGIIKEKLKEPASETTKLSM